MAQAQRPHFHFHYSRNWLKSHPRLTDRLKTFGIALGAAILAAAAADITAAIALRPMDTPRFFPAQGDEQAKGGTMRRRPGRL